MPRELEVFYTPAPAGARLRAETPARTLPLPLPPTSSIEEQDLSLSGAPSVASRPLGAFETALAMSSEYGPFHVVIALRLDQPPPEANLPEALNALQRSLPTLHLSLRREGRRRWFVLGSAPEIPLVVLPRRGNDHWLEVSQEEASKRLDVSSGPLLRVTYLAPAGDPSPGDLIVSCHHTILDHESGQTLLERLLHAWAGTPLPRTVHPEIPPPSDRFYPPERRGIRGLTGTLGFLGRQAGDELAYRLRMIGKADPPPPRGARTQIDHFEISREATRRILATARSRGITANSLLSAATLLALWRIRHAGRPRPMRGITFAGLRPYLKPPLDPGIPGTYISMMRYTERLRHGDDLWSVAERVHQRLTRAFRRGEKFTAASQAPTAMRMILSGRAGRMGAAALTYAGPLTLTRNYGRTRILNLHSFVSAIDLGPEYSAAACLWDGGLQFDVMTLDREMTPADVRQISDEILRLLLHAS